MHQEAIATVIRQVDLFSGLDESVIQKIIAAAHYRKIARDELIIHENTLTKSIFIIVSGEFSVYKNDLPDEFQFAMLRPYNVVGELAFIDELPRSTNVKAINNDCAVLEIDHQVLNQITAPIFYKKMAKKLTHDVRTNNAVIVDNLKDQLAQKTRLANMGRFITYVLLAVSVYSLAIKGFSALTRYPYTKMYAGTAVILFFVIFIMAMVKHMGYSMRVCGVNKDNWRISLKESILATMIFIILITVLKKLLMDFHILPVKTLLDFHSMIPIQVVSDSTFYVWLVSSMLVYSLFAVLQEFITRGVIQGMLQDFLAFKHSKWVANLTATTVFAASHTHLSAVFALVVIFPSLLWGWLYSRHRTLIGPSVSHILIGLWAIFALGIQELLSAHGQC